MKIDRDEARRIATLARLEFDDAALDAMAAEMTSILGYVDQLAEVDREPLEAAKAGPPAPPRADVLEAPVATADVAANAPAWRDGFFVVPRVIGE